MPVIQTESEHKPPVNGSYFACINPEDGGCLLEKYSEKYRDYGCALLANLFASEGQPGKVIFVHKNTMFFRVLSYKFELLLPQIWFSKKYPKCLSQSSLA